MDETVVIFYAAPIFTAAFLCGRGAGCLVAVTSALAGLAADLTNPGRLGSAYPYWNAAVRMALFLLTAEVVASLAEALRREQEVARREREAAEQLRELDRMKDSILQTIAHDRLAGGSVFNLLLPGSDEERLRPVRSRCLSPVQRETDEILGMVVFAVVLVMIFILILGAIYYFGVQRSKPAETVVIPEPETATP